MDQIRETAPAKINLFLHVLGRRDDGYHELSSLVAFASVADTLTLESSNTLSLEITGPFARDLDPEGPNLVRDAARAFADGADDALPGGRFILDKQIPVAAGVGGGSADAAAALRALLRRHDAGLPAEALYQIAAGLGADVPVCLASRTQLMGGIGQVLEPAPELPKTPAVLVNPGVALATRTVFSALGLSPGETPHVPEMPFTLKSCADVAELSRWLGQTRNDLEPAAVQCLREIADVEEALFAAPGCLLARMSGSGPTCFGLFVDETAALNAAVRIASDHPRWWVRACELF